MSSRGGLRGAAVLTLWLLAGLDDAPCAAQAEQQGARLRSTRSNVVRVIAGGATGFGFVVGLGARTLLIATAEHTLDDGGVAPRICFLGRGEPCPTGTVVYVDDPEPGRPDLDLAIVEVEYPEGLAWRPDVMARPPAAGEPAWFIGRDADWYVPAVPGRIVATDPAGHGVLYEALPVAQGVSGAPVLTPDGIAAMHVESAGGDGHSRGIALAAIRDRVVDRLRRQWVLVPPARCPRQDAHGEVLAGQRIVVNFSWNHAASAMEAMARLRCLGALTLPRPLWSPQAGAGPGITYRSGALRTARTLQTVLAPLGRLDARLGTPQDDAELWLP